MPFMLSGSVLGCLLSPMLCELVLESFLCGLEADQSISGVALSANITSTRCFSCDNDVYEIVANGASTEGVSEKVPVQN